MIGARFLLAGAAYFAVVFALGFILGTIRTLVVARWPGIAMWQAVLVELPLMLGFSWWVCRKLVAGFHIPATIAARFWMSAVALVLLFLADAWVGGILTGQTFGNRLRAIFGPANTIGLIGQFAFGFFPIVQLWTAKPRTNRR